MRKIAVSPVGLSVRAVARLLTTLALALLALAGAGYPTMAAKPADVITLTSPNNTLIAQSDDYATQVLGDPWDMNNAEDTSYLDHITPPNLSNGIWSAQTTAQGSFIYLVSQGWNGSMEYVGERNGVNYPISTSRFTHLRFRMYSSVADQAVIWWTTSHGTGTSGNTTFIPTQVGWHTYDVNLLAGGPGSNGSWTSQAYWNGLWLSP